MANKLERSRKNTPATKSGITQKNNTLKASTKTATFSQSYSGAIPPPGMLKDFDSIIDNGANRIMDMAELGQKADIELNKNHQEILKDAVTKEHMQVILGQIFSFILIVLILIGGIYLITKGYEKIGIGLLSIPALGGLSKIFITRR